MPTTVPSVIRISLHLLQARARLLTTTCPPLGRQAERLQIHVVDKQEQELQVWLLLITCMLVNTGGSTGGSSEGATDGRTEGSTGGGTEGNNGRTEGSTGGSTDGLTVGSTEGSKGDFWPWTTAIEVRPESVKKNSTISCHIYN